MICGTTTRDPYDKTVICEREEGHPGPHHGQIKVGDTYTSYEWVDSTTRDAVAGRAAAEAGMEQAARAERVRLWKLDADAWLASLTQGGEFRADDLVSVIGLPDEGVARNNVVGAWISGQSKRGTIEWTGRFQHSDRVIRHRNLQRVWRVA